MKILPNGDKTIIGERGITLSGGQKARISFARALYFDGDIFLLDDPISAVDSKVAKKLYENAILKMRGHKTVILVTHQIQFLGACDSVIIMDYGRIAYKDKPQNLRS